MANQMSAQSPPSLWLAPFQLLIILVAWVLLTEPSRGEYPPGPIVSDDLLFEAQEGTAVVEAEHFHRQSNNAVRGWYFNSALHRPNTQPDFDEATFQDAGGRWLRQSRFGRLHRGQHLV